MILDLSQEKDQNGILSFDIDAELKDKEKEFISNNVLNNELNVDKEYRMALCMQDNSDRMSPVITSPLSHK